MKISCPECNAFGQIDDKWRGKNINCPKCKQVFTAEDHNTDSTDTTSSSTATAKNAPASPQAPPALNMNKCSQCNKEKPKDSLLDFNGVLVCSSCKTNYLQRMREGVSSGKPGGGGNIDDAIAGNYDFEVMEVIREAWEKTKGAKGSIWAGFIIFYVGLGIVMTLFSLPLAFLGMSAGESESMLAITMALNFLIQLGSTGLMIPMMAGMMMIGVRRSVDQPFNFKFCWAYFKWFLPLFIAYLVMTLLMSIGFILLIIPGIYLSIAYTMTMPLILEKGLKPWEALETSRKAIGNRWFKIFGIYCLMGLIYLLSIIPLGIGLIWTIPMFFVLQGILYRNVFGVGPATENV